MVLTRVSPTYVRHVVTLQTANNVWVLTEGSGQSAVRAKSVKVYYKCVFYKLDGYTIITLVTINTSAPSQSSVNVVVVVDKQFHKVAQAVAGGRPQTIAKAVFREPSTRREIIRRFIAVINEECSDMCKKSVEPVSLFQAVSFEPSLSFSWTRCIEELQTKCPILLQLLWAIVGHSDHRNRVKQGEHHYPGMCAATAILLKERNKHMLGIQTLLSLVLYSSRVQKKV